MQKKDVNDQAVIDYLNQERSEYRIYSRRKLDSDKQKVFLNINELAKPHEY